MQKEKVSTEPPAEALSEAAAEASREMAAPLHGARGGHGRQTDPVCEHPAAAGARSVPSGWTDAGPRSLPPYVPWSRS